MTERGVKLSQLPDELTIEFFDELSERIGMGEFQYLQDTFNGNRGLAERIENQAPEVGEIMAGFTADGYFAQNIDMPPSCPVKFRTLSAYMQDRVIGDGESTNLAARERMRRRLSYGVLEYNDSNMGAMSFEGSLYEILDNEDMLEEIHTNAESRFDRLAMMPDILVHQLSTAYTLWERTINNVLRDIEGDPVKKSTGTPASDASRD